jgi:signal transduction histidine kinase
MKEVDLSTHVADPGRLAALRAVALLDTPTEESFDRLTWLAARITHAPVALVSLIDADRQFFKSCLGLPEPWLSRRETPLSHSFCQYNRVPNHPLLVRDARIDPLFKDNPAIRDLQVIAYLGIPLVTSDGYVLGSFCVIDKKPRRWTGDDISVLEKLSLAVMTEIQLRAEVSVRQRTEERLRAQNEELRRVHEDLEKESAERLQALEQLRQRENMLLHQSRLAAMGEMISNIAHQWRQPLNVLALIAQELPVTARTGALSGEELQDKVHKMMDVIVHMSKTIDDFRNFFGPGTVKVEFPVRETIDRTLSLLEGALKQRQIKVEVIEESSPIVRGCPNELAQVLINIIMNAKDAFVAKEVPEPAITIRIGNAGGRAFVTIADNAGGVPDDIIGRIFEPYFTTKGPDKGTGIGLYMSKMIIENNMEGSLTVRNVDGGAEFRILF